MWLVLLATPPGDVWEPVPRPVIAVNVEATLSPGATFTRDRAIRLLIEAVDEATAGRGVSLPASVVTVCGGDTQCRLDLARTSSSNVLVTYYVLAADDELMFDLEVRSTTLAASSPASVIATAPSRWTGPASATDDTIHGWLVDVLGGLRVRLPYQAPRVVDIAALPPGSLVRVGDASVSVAGDQLRLARPARGALTVRIEAPDYEALEVIVAPDEERVEFPIERATPSPQRRIRQATFWSGVALTAVGAALIVASTTRTSGVCFRSPEAEGPCADPLLLGSTSSSPDLLVPSAIGLATSGLVIASGPLWRHDREAETGLWVAGAGVAFGVLAAGVAYSLGAVE